MADPYNHITVCFGCKSTIYEFSVGYWIRSNDDINEVYCSLWCYIHKHDTNDENDINE